MDLKSKGQPFENLDKGMPFSREPFEIWTRMFFIWVIHSGSPLFWPSKAFMMPISNANQKSDHLAIGLVCTIRIQWGLNSDFGWLNVFPFLNGARFSNCLQNGCHFGSVFNYSRSLENHTCVVQTFHSDHRSIH